MTTDPRAALDRLIAALEAHFDAVSNRRSELDPRIEDTYDLLADAFEVYDDALSVTYNEYLPFAIDEDEDDEDDEELSPEELAAFQARLEEVERALGRPGPPEQLDRDPEVIDALDEIIEDSIAEAEELAGDD